MLKCYSLDAQCAKIAISYLSDPSLTDFHSVMYPPVCGAFLCKLSKVSSNTPVDSFLSFSSSLSDATESKRELDAVFSDFSFCPSSVSSENKYFSLEFVFRFIIVILLCVDTVY